MDSIENTTSQMRRRTDQTILTKVKGHSGLEGNEKADGLAKKGAQTHEGPEIEINPVEGYSALGAKLRVARLCSIGGFWKGNPLPNGKVP